MIPHRGGGDHRLALRAISTEKIVGDQSSDLAAYMEVPGAKQSRSFDTLDIPRQAAYIIYKHISYISAQIYVNTPRTLINCLREGK